MQENYGYVVTPNSANDLAQARQSITNPKYVRIKALLYSTVEEMNPEKFAGRADLIDRAINDPEQQGKILQNFYKRIANS